MIDAEDDELNDELPSSEIITIQDIVYAYQATWAIQAGHLVDLMALLPRLVGKRAEEARWFLGILPNAVSWPSQPATGGIGILPIRGTIWPRNGIAKMLGLPTAELITKAFRNLVERADLKAIVLDIDSTGGVVEGIDELAEEIWKARKTKRVIAVSNYLMASAAYWIGSCASEVVVSPSSETGSIGVFAVHEDESKALEKEGVKVTLISEGKYKTEGNPYEPLSPGARAGIQEQVANYYGMFTRRVAVGRGVSSIDVRAGFGEGRAVGAQQAVQLGLADRVATLDQVLRELKTNKNPRGTAGERALSGAANTYTADERTRLFLAEVGDASVSRPVLERAKAALAYCQGDLHLGPLSIYWFRAAYDPGTNGFYNPSHPEEIWLSDQISITGVARTVAHECRHAWQYQTQPGYQIATNPDAQSWRDQDARSYAQEFEQSTRGYSHPNGQVVFCRIH